MNNDKYILLSTPTSATGSVWRILTKLSSKKFKTCSVIDYYNNNGIKPNDVKNHSLPDNFNLYLFNQPHLFNFEQDLSEFKFIINLRDPRDLVCNQFHWLFSHPISAERESFMQKRREQVKEAGISAYGLKSDISFFYESFFKLFEIIPAEKICVISYAQMCLMSDNTIEKLARFVKSTLTEEDIALLKEKEFPSELQKNTANVASKWIGSDVLPGRARTELDYETFKLLTKRYEHVLAFMQEKDLPSLSGLYQ